MRSRARVLFYAIGVLALAGCAGPTQSPVKPTHVTTAGPPAGSGWHCAYRFSDSRSGTSYCFRTKDQCIKAVHPMYSNGCQGRVTQAVCYTAFQKTAKSFVSECSVTVADCERKRTAIAVNIADYSRVADCKSWL